MSQVAQNLEEVHARRAAAARRAGRDPAAVRLVAVSKTVPVELLQDALAAGQRLFGENYLKEAEPKIAVLGPGVSWHFVGHLQSNKARGVVALFDLIHSVDRLRLAQAVSDAAARVGKVQDILLQVNLAGEETKSGAPPEEVPDLVRRISLLPHLRLRGLMTMPPYFPDPELSRPFFQALRELRDLLAALELTRGPLPELSMGMTGDFEVAVEEGATLVRVGTAVFGPRPRKP